MNLCSPSVIKNLCKELNIRPAKSKGQNFLIDGNILQKIVEAADLKKTDNVLEVGPGLGCLTVELAKRAGKVISVELDRKLAAYLRKMMAGRENVRVVESDVLKFSIFSLGSARDRDFRFSIDETTDNDAAIRRIPNTGYQIQDTGYKIVANLPYNITSRFLRKFLTAENKPSEMVLLVQKEVARRICAKPGEMSLLAVSVQFYGKPKIVDYVSKNCFWPKPRVDSAILVVKLRENYKLPVGEASRLPLCEASRPRNCSWRGTEASPKRVMHGVLARQDASFGVVSCGWRGTEASPNNKHNEQAIDFESHFFRVVKIGFSAKRKQLANNLASGLNMDKDAVKKILIGCGLNEKIRAEELSVEDWVEIVSKTLSEVERLD